MKDITKLPIKNKIEISKVLCSVISETLSIEVNNQDFESKYEDVNIILSKHLGENKLETLDLLKELDSEGYLVLEYSGNIFYDEREAPCFNPK